MKKLTDVVPADRAAAKHPKADRYHLATAQPGVTEVEVSNLIAALAVIERPDHILETGTSYGDTTRAIGAALDDHQTLWTVEMNASRLERAKARTTFYQGLGRTKFINASAMDWKPPNDVEFGMAFIDASMDRVGEFMALRPWIATGALVAFHDTNTPHASNRGSKGSTRQQVQGMIDSGHLSEGIWFDTPRGVWVGRVK